MKAAFLAPSRPESPVWPAQHGPDRVAPERVEARAGRPGTGDARVDRVGRVEEVRLAPGTREREPRRGARRELDYGQPREPPPAAEPVEDDASEVGPQDRRADRVVALRPQVERLVAGRVVVRVRAERDVGDGMRRAALRHPRPGAPLAALVLAVARVERLRGVREDDRDDLPVTLVCLPDL